MSLRSEEPISKWEIVSLDVEEESVRLGLVSKERLAGLSVVLEFH